MARIVLGSYLVRYPLGGMMSYVLQYLVGFSRLGHDIYFVEKSGYPNSCYDPLRNMMSDDCSFGITATNNLLQRFCLDGRWCFVDQQQRYHGLSRAAIEEIFRTADLFIDMGTHGAWLNETTSGMRVLLDGEPGFTQMKMMNRLAAGEPLDQYDRYYTCGANVGRPGCSAPTAGRDWRLLWHPVLVDEFSFSSCPAGAPFTTVMNWKSHDPIQYAGRSFGQKDIEFEKFLSLPKLTDMPIEIAVSGKYTPISRLRDAGWRVRDAHQVTATCDSFAKYIRESLGEFSVAKNVFVATRSGWFSDRSAIYLASGRPVVLEDTGFSAHLPCGRGLFAVGTAEEAAAALTTIAGDFETHARAAREIAAEYLDASVLLRRFLNELGIN
jgi:hypothetical protein